MLTSQPYELAYLFDRISQGDEDAFKILYQQTGPKLSGYIYKLTGSREMVRDILQEAMFRLWVGREKLPVVQMPQSWLYKVVANECYHHLRKDGLQKRLLDEMTAQSGLQEFSDSTERELSYRQTRLVIQEAVSSLSPQRKRIYLMSRENGLKIPEIAASLGLSEQYVKKALMVSLKMVRKKLLEAGIRLPAILIWIIS